jgi:hypothetical protein
LVIRVCPPVAEGKDSQLDNDASDDNCHPAGKQAIVAAQGYRSLVAHDEQIEGRTRPLLITGITQLADAHVSSVEGGLVKLMYCPKENGPTLTIKVRGEHITGTTATGRAVQTIDQPAPMCLSLSMYSSLCPKGALDGAYSLPAVPALLLLEGLLGKHASSSSALASCTVL